MFKKIIAGILTVGMVFSIASVTASAAQQTQKYVYNSLSGYVKMTGSVHAVTPDGSYISVGDAITRSDYVPGLSQKYNYVRLTAQLYRDYTSLPDGGVLLGESDTAGNIAIGNYISTGSKTIDSSKKAQKVGSRHTMVFPDQRSYVGTVGIKLESGILSEDTSVHTTY